MSVRAIVARLALAALIALSLPPGAVVRAQIADGDIELEIALEDLDHVPYPGEMVMLTIRGRYRLPVTLEQLEQPDLAGLDWMQLGEDRWFNTVERGQTVLNLERRMALFAQRPGEVEIGAFTHNLNLLARDGRRFEHAARSNEVTLTVTESPHAAEGWFPVRGIEVSDAWSNPPERLPAGGAALRIVTLTVLGAEPELIPPMPEMTGAGAMIFPHPEKRLVGLSPDGPMTRVFWRWTVRPSGRSAGYLDPISFSYFDTGARETRTITLSAQRVAYPGAVDGAGPDTGDGADAPAGGATGATGPGGAQPAEAPAPLRPTGAPAVPLGPLALGLGLVIGLAAAGGNLRRGAGAGVTLRRLPPTAGSWAMRRAARRGDATAFWRHAHAMLTARGLSPPPELRALEAGLFGEDPLPPDLRPALRAVRARLAEDESTRSG